MPLTDTQVNTVCGLWNGAMQCRYLSTNSSNGHQCLKLNSRLKRKVDKEVDQHVKREVKSGSNPWQGYKSIYDGGSCPGFIMLSQVKQGK